jgi:dolichol-phosphate mannosyltransferase
VARSLEVLVCDDGSKDDTYGVLRRLAAGDPRVRVLHRPGNRGIEASLSALYAAARHEHIFLISADRQWPMTSLVTLAKALERGADVVVGTRRNKEGVYSFYRRLVSGIFERSVRALGAPVGDPGSIKLGRAEALRVPIVSRGVFAEGERLIRAARAGYRLAACDVEFRPRRSGKASGARPGLVLRASADLVRCCLSLAVGWPRPIPPRADPGLVEGHPRLG